MICCTYPAGTPRASPHYLPLPPNETTKSVSYRPFRDNPPARAHAIKGHNRRSQQQVSTPYSTPHSPPSLPPSLSPSLPPDRLTDQLAVQRFIISPLITRRHYSDTLIIIMYIRKTTVSTSTSFVGGRNLSNNISIHHTPRAFCCFCGAHTHTPNTINTLCSTQSPTPNTQHPTPDTRNPLYVPA